MLELKKNLKRQIEILGICLSGNNPVSLKTFDLADMFHVDEITIKRDLKALRSSGIDIHSWKKKGIVLSRTPGRDKLREYIHYYAAVANTDNFVERATSLLINRLGEKSLANMVALQFCIENKTSACIDYEKESSEIESGREVQPLLIFQNDNYWRLLAVNDGMLKQYHLNKILEVRNTGRKFKPLPRESVMEIFRYSWRSWLGPDKYKVKLKFSRKWAERLAPKHIMENETLTRNRDGSIIYEATVNSYDEIATWIAGRGEGITVLQPDELKQKVISLAKQTLKNYAPNP